MADRYIQYYLNQAEGRNYGGLYRGNSQKGDGLGSYLGGLFRRMLPLFTSGARSIGSEAVSTGINLLKDMMNGVPMKEAVKERVSKAGYNLTNKAADKLSSMVGSGYKRRKNYRPSQSINGSKRRKVKTRKKTKRKPRDIFGL